MDGREKIRFLKEIKCISKISSKLWAIFLRSPGGNNICFVEWLSNIMDEWSGDTHFLCWSLLASLMCLVWPPPRLIWGPPPPTQPPSTHLPDWVTDTHHCLQHPASLHHMETLSKNPSHQIYIIFVINIQFLSIRRLWVCSWGRSNAVVESLVAAGAGNHTGHLCLCLTSVGRNQWLWHNQ